MLQMGIPGHAVAEGRAGDDGHVQKAGVAQKPAQLHLLRQRLMESGAVCSVSGVDENGGPAPLPALLQRLDELGVIRSAVFRGLRLGQHQDLQARRPVISASC